MDSMRDQMKHLLEDVDTFEGKLTSISLVSLNILFILIYVIETYSISQSFHQILWITEILITGIFAVEYFARVYVSEKGRKKVFEPLMIADFLAILPVLVILVGPGTALSAGFLKVFRVFRIFRFFRVVESREFLWGKVSKTDLQIMRFAMVIFSVFFVTAGFFHELESGVNPNVETFRDSLYYTVVTLTTVGFGDITPVTNLGRWVTVISILAGIVIIPWQASRIVKAWQHQEKVEVKCPECGLKYHDRDASHCKSCGHVIDQEYDSRDTNYL